MYDELLFNPDFMMRKLANEISYFWDRLIHNFTNNMLKGEMEDVGEHKFNFKESEEAVRYMALEDRYLRRVNSIAIDEIIRSYTKDQSRSSRALLPTVFEKKSKTGYVFLMLARPKDMKFPEQYAEYREYRVTMLAAYCYFHANRHRHIERMIGIALEPPPKITGDIGMSEELLMVEVKEWNDELVKNTEKGAALFRIGEPGNTREKQATEREFPSEIYKA